MVTFQLFVLVRLRIQTMGQGYSASQAADEFLRRGDHISADILAKMKKSEATRIGREAGKTLLFDDGSPCYSAMRLFRTEINRAHGLPSRRL